eukprot:GFUD01033824.1.p1 GENE.GFUD01033824.1~~GFUD01033824.1.p1  ORF type:complete len:290 (-),score=40.33 GFUD01033824.1:75-944(-)
MSSLFPDALSFRTWLGTKSEAELRTMLYRADNRARLNGSQGDLVRRLDESTRNLGRERQLVIFPELRRRRQGQRSSSAMRVAIRNPRGPASSLPNVSQIRAVLRTFPRAQERGPSRSSDATANSANRPVPTFYPSGPSTTTAGFRNPINLPSLAGNHQGAGRTPEQLLRETLEVQAGLIIQSISQAATPRLRRNSLSRMGAAACPVRSRAASISSVEKTGPEVSLEEVKFQVKLECKICFDSPVNTVLLPCGHACCCQDCSVRLKFATWDSKCPICRNRIQSISMLYFS